MIDALMALAGPGAQMEEESDFPLVENYGGDGKKLLYVAICGLDTLFFNC